MCSNYVSVKQNSSIQTIDYFHEIISVVNSYNGGEFYNFVVAMPLGTVDRPIY